jgi:hypothetical protein
MKKSESQARIVKKKEVSKELISKLYFSRTQDCYLKKYAAHTDYITELGELMGKVNKKKIMKIIEEVKQTNNVFRKYLEKKDISRLRIEDIQEF